MIVGIEESFIYLLAGWGIASTVLAAFMFFLIKLGGGPAMAYIKAGWKRGSRVLHVYGTDQSCRHVIARAAGDGVIDESHNQINGAYITPKGSFYVAEKFLVAPVYSPFGLAWNAEVVAFLNWVKKNKKKESMQDVLTKVGNFVDEPVLDNEGNQLIDPESKKPITQRILKGIDPDKIAQFKYSVEEEWGAVCKEHNKYISGLAMQMETVLGWVTKNISPAFFRSIVELEKARIARRLSKDRPNQIVLYGIFLLFALIGITILWVGTGGFTGGQTTVIERVTQAFNQTAIGG